MAKFTINGTELEFDILDADKAALYETGIENIELVSNEVKNEQKLSVIIRKQCNAIFDFVNMLFGEGTDKKLFGDSTNLAACMEVYFKILEEIPKDRVLLDNIAKKAQKPAAKKRA